MKKIANISGMNLYRTHKQGGAVLIVGLVMLLVLTIIGTSGMTSITMEERMVSNMQNSTLAFFGAEAVLTECEDQVASAQLQDVQPGVNNIQDYEQNLNDWGSSDWWDDPAFWVANGIESQETGLVASTTNYRGVSAPPRCVIEYVGEVSADSLETDVATAGTGQKASARFVYRVVAASTGADPKSRSVVESLFVKR